MMFSKKSVIVQWLISCILLLSIPIVSAGAVFVSLSLNVRDSVIKFNTTILQSMKKDFDNDILNLRRVYIELEANKNIDRIVNGFNNEKKYDNKYAVDALKDLRVLVNSNNSIGSIYVCFLEKDIALHTAIGVSDVKTINQTAFGTKEFSQIDGFLKENVRGGYCGLNLMEEDNVRNTVAYVCPLPLGSRTNRMKAIAVVSMNMDYFESKLTRMQELNGSNIALFDDNNTAFYAIGDVMEINTAKRSDGMYDDSHNIISFVDLSVPGWYFALVTSKQVFWKDLNSARLLCILSMIISVILGGICIYYILKKNYLPLKRVVDYVLQKKRNVNAAENEYDLLQSFIDNILDDENLVRRNMEKQERLLMHSYFVRLLRGQLNHTLPDEMIPRVQFLSDQFMIAIFDIKNYDALFAEEAMQYNERFETAQLIVSNVMEEVVSKHHLCYVVENDGFFVAIISLSEKRENPEKDITEALDEGNSFILDKFSLLVNIAMGGIHQGINGISQSYREACEVLEYTRITSEDGIVEYHSLFGEQSGDGDYYYPVEKEVQLINAIKMGSYRGVKEILDEIFEVNFKEKKITASMFQCLAVGIAGSFLKVAADKDIEHAIGGLFDTDNTVMIKERIFEIAEKLCAQDCFHVKSAEPGLEEKIKTYILEHYSEQTLCIQSIGDFFGMQGYYLSKIFKNTTGGGILDYIRHIRTEKAKKMIEENPHIKLETIAEAVGFSNARSLTRAFKQEYGILPGEYRGKIE